jgi:CRISPR-associated endonuclease Cas2
MVNPRKNQEVAISIAGKVLEILFDKASEFGEKIATEKMIDCIDEEDYRIGREKIPKILYDFKRMNYIRREGDSVILTHKAKMRVVDKITKKIPASKKNHLVSFDIPEGMRRNRNQFRRTLKRIGFIQIQKSLWAIRKDVGALVDATAGEYKVNEYVAYFISEKSNIDKYIDKKIGKG